MLAKSVHQRHCVCLGRQMYNTAMSCTNRLKKQLIWRVKTCRLKIQWVERLSYAGVTPRSISKQQHWRIDTHTWYRRERIGTDGKVEKASRIRRDIEWAVAQSPILITTITLERLRKRGYHSLLDMYFKRNPTLCELRLNGCKANQVIDFT